MSWQATAWALEQDVATPSEMVTLIAICNYVDFNGRCWPSQELLARQTKQSVDSVQRRLRDLEARGLIYRPPQRRKTDGRNGGEWTTGLIIVLIDDICHKEALKHGFDPSERACGVPASDPKNEGEADQSLDGDAAPQSAVRANDGSHEINQLYEGLRQHGAADCGGVEEGDRTANCGASRTALVRHGIVNDEYISPPKSPPPSPAVDLDDGSWLSDWSAFEELWIWSGNEPRDRIRRKFRLLQPETRRDVLTATSAYLADCAAKKRRPCSARAFIQDGIFKNWTRAGRELAARGGDKKIGAASIFVLEGTPAFEAWQNRWRIENRMPPSAKMLVIASTIDGVKKRGIWKPTLFPPRLSDESRPPGSAGASVAG